MATNPTDDAAKVNSSTRLKLWAEVLSQVPFVGKILKIIIDGKDWGFLTGAGLAVFFLLVYPLMVPLIAAKLINYGVLYNLRDDYAAAVRTAFRVKEAADEVNREANTRLDYFYAIEFTGHPRNSRTYEIPMHPRQYAVLRVDPGQLQSRSPDCEVGKAYTGKGAELMVVRLGGRKLLTVTNQGAAGERILSDDDWAKIKPSPSQTSQKLTFEPVEGLRSGCEGLEVEVRATLQVFKKLVEMPAAAETNKK